VEADKHYHFEKFARGVEGLAKAEFNPMIIKIEDWIVSGKYENGDFKKPVFRIKAKNEILAIDLELIPSKDMVLHGDRGLSQKSNEKGNASYYYSFTRLNTHGLISLNGKNHKVMGNSWMDREWSTSALSKGQTGWDWFSIQLDDTSEIMYFRLRDSINNTNFAKGTLVFANSEYINLKSDDIILETLESTKLESGTVYPYKWRMKIPEYKIDLNIETMIKEQEMKLSVKYYEGCIKLSGNKNNKIINGYGFVELTGYGDKL
jgi:predicted secreted hydrolase